MSSAGNSGGGEMAGNSPQNYYCYGCQSTVSLTPLPNCELSCPNCNGTFLEESQTVPPPDPITGDNPFGDDSSFSFPTNSGNGGGDELPALFDGGALFGQSPVELDPVTFINSYLRDGDATIQLLVENNLIRGGGSENGLPENFGDYFVGPDLEQLIHQLAESDLNMFGTPPAAKSAVSGLPDVKVSDELLNSDLSQCAVCKDGFKLDELVKQMPCKHMYHDSCILPWLEMRNSCPVCRFELPTDDSDYENMRSRNANNGGLFSLGSEGGGNQGNARTVDSNGGLFSLGSEGGGNQGNPRTVDSNGGLFSLGSEGGGIQGNARTVESNAGLFSLGSEGGENQGNRGTVDSNGGLFSLGSEGGGNQGSARTVESYAGLFSLGAEGGGNQGNPRTVESYAGLFSLGAEGGGNQGNPRTVERRVRISLPGLLRGLQSHAETSNSTGGGGSNDGVNNDGNSSGSGDTHGEPNPRPRGQGQANQEDLD
ncbi:hypothetical protein KY289_028178 [Solanum tuberosum]|nr:hypothetical protein KY289_028178 [Solanum tuberosum]KAH0663044.1 hypothetical protein KY284_027975 [Solanum tuberosum]